MITLPLDVSVDVEVSEENNEGGSVSKESVVHPFGEITVNVERVRAMDEGKRKLQLGRDRENG